MAADSRVTLFVTISEHRRAEDDQAACNGGGTAQHGLLPYLACDGYYGLPTKRDTLERAMQTAARESARTTKLYDRTHNEVSLDEIERIRI